MSTPRVADDFDEIKKRMITIQGERSGYCAIRDGKSTSDCWCYRGPNEASLPCPAPVTKPEIYDEFSCG